MARIIGSIVAVILILLGLLFLVASAKSNTVPRIIVGVAAIGMGSGVAWLVVIKRPEVIKKIELTQKIDLSGDVDLEGLKCRNCGADLDRKSIEVRAGAVFVKCPYCNTDYQVVEEPKW